jgi:integrase
MKRSVSVTYHPTRKRWIVDYRDLDGVRRRVVCVTESEAIDKKDDIVKSLGFQNELRDRGLEVVTDKKGKKNPDQLVETELRDAIEKYCTTIKGVHSSAGYQVAKEIFSEFYSWCVEDRVKLDPKTKKPLPGHEPLIYVDQLDHLSIAEYQAFLGTDRTRVVVYNKDSGKETKIKVKPQSAASINRKFSTLKPFFTKCKLWRFTNVDLNEGITARSVSKEAKRKPWSKEETSAMLMELGVEASDCLLTLAVTGLRPTQGFQLRYTHINWKRKTLATWTIKGGVRRDYEIPLSDSLYEFLLQKYELHKKSGRKDDDLIFKNTKGVQWNRTSFGRHIRMARIKLGFEGLVTYGVRHAFATELIKANVNTRKVQLLMGHSKFETTVNYTRSITGEVLHDEVNNLEKDRKLI